MPLTDLFQGHVDVALSNLALSYRNAELISEVVAPRVNVGRQSDFYWIHGRDSQIPETDDIRAATAASKLIKMTLSSDTYMCPDHSLADLIPVEDIPKPGLQPRADRATMTITDKLLLNREVRVAAFTFAAATYPTGHKVQLTGNDKWNVDHADSDPIEDIEIGKEAVALALGLEPNLLVLGRKTLRALVSNDAVRSQFKTGLTTIRVADLEDLLQIRIAVGRGIKRDAAGTNTFVWGPHAALLHVQPTPGQQDVSFAKTFFWDSAPNTVAGFGVLRGPVTPPSRQAEELSVHIYEDEKVTSSESGYFIEDAAA